MIEEICHLLDLEVGVPTRFVVRGEPLCVVRTSDEIVKAVSDTCTHEDYSLSEGWLCGNAVECVLHGSQFDLDSGKPDAPPANEAVRVYQCVVDEGTVAVVLPDTDTLSSWRSGSAQGRFED